MAWNDYKILMRLSTIVLNQRRQTKFNLHTNEKISTILEYFQSSDLIYPFLERTFKARGFTDWDKHPCSVWSKQLAILIIKFGVQFRSNLLHCLSHRNEIYWNKIFYFISTMQTDISSVYNTKCLMSLKDKGHIIQKKSKWGKNHP